MRVLRAMILGALGTVLGYFVAALLGDLVMGLTGVSNFEGGRAMTSAFVFGPLGGLLGLGIGIWLGLRRRGQTLGLGRAALQGALALLGLAALVAGGIYLYWISGEHRLTYDGAGATLDFEIRVPAGYALPARSDAIETELDAGSSRMAGFLDKAWLRHEGDWSILSGGVELYLRLASRLLVLRLQDGKDRIFRIRLPATPDPAVGWSDWQKLDFIGAPGQSQPAKPGPEDPFEIRYKVEVWGQS